MSKTTNPFYLPVELRTMYAKVSVIDNLPIDLRMKLRSRFTPIRGAIGLWINTGTVRNITGVTLHYDALNSHALLFRWTNAEMILFEYATDRLNPESLLPRKANDG